MEAMLLFTPRELLFNLLQAYVILLFTVSVWGWGGGGPLPSYRLDVTTKEVLVLLTKLYMVGSTPLCCDIHFSLGS